jgi:DNA methylase
MPRGRNGQIYATDVWDGLPDERRPGLLRYDNALPVALVSRLIRATTGEGDLVADPSLGSGTTAAACLHNRRRFYGGDVNPAALRFAMARIPAEVIRPRAPRRPWPASHPAGSLSADSSRCSRRHATGSPAC